MTPQEMYTNALRATARAHGNTSQYRKPPMMDTQPQPISAYAQPQGVSAPVPPTVPHNYGRPRGSAPIPLPGVSAQLPPGGIMMDTQPQPISAYARQQGWDGAAPVGAQPAGGIWNNPLSGPRPQMPQGPLPVRRPDAPGTRWTPNSPNRY